ncbi:uncharacterized protein LOC114541761, partial [Dendronephthya gigantea]|uniref:uncharacterized protein LOC114541761 n=1 Tax=Dendronephthya gigantea TaxID=151771 RepID=UPI00106C9B0A
MVLESKEHSGHPVGESSSVNQVIEKRIIERIYDLAKKNVTGVKECNDDQESLLRKITDLKKSSPSTRFFLRTQEGEPNYFGASVPTNDSDNFLFVHQEEWQQKLLLKYGSDLVLLDATYKTTKYAMPLFFLCVNTNVGYKVVAEFMCQHEDETSISEALGAFRKSQALNIVNTNNGVESMNRLFKYDYLPRSIDKSLYGIVVMIVCSFLPDSYQTNLSANLRLSGSYRKYNAIVHDYLQNRPPNFVKHCLKNKFAAQEIQEKDITCLNDQQGKFLVKSSNKKLSYLVKFSFSSCTCESWRQSTFPCKHFFAIFNFFSKWQFSSLSLAYRESVFITLDTNGFLIIPPTSIKKTVDPPETPDVTPEGSPPDLQALGSNQSLSANNFTSPVEPGTLATLKRQFQDKLSGLKNISFLVEDAKMLRDAINIADNLQVALRSTCPKVDGLFLRSSPEK